MERLGFIFQTPDERTRGVAREETHLRGLHLDDLLAHDVLSHLYGRHLIRERVLRVEVLRRLGGEGAVSQRRRDTPRMLRGVSHALCGGAFRARTLSGSSP